MAQLISVACLSLAIKMEETEVPLLLDLQVNNTQKKKNCFFGASHIDQQKFGFVRFNRLARLVMCLRLKLYKEWSFWSSVPSIGGCKPWPPSLSSITSLTNSAMAISRWWWCHCSLAPQSSFSTQWFKVCLVNALSYFVREHEPSIHDIFYFSKHVTIVSWNICIVGNNVHICKHMNGKFRNNYWNFLSITGFLLKCASIN